MRKINFSNKIKNELLYNNKSRILDQNQFHTNSKLVFIYIAILYSEQFSIYNITINLFSKDLIIFITKEIEQKILLESKESKKIFEFKTIEIKNKEKKYSIQSIDLKNNLKIIKYLAYIYHNIFISTNTQEIIKYIFIVCGNIKDPQQKYYLDFSNKNKILILNLQRKLIDLGFKFKYKKSNQKHVIYISQSDLIEDFLTYIGASKLSLEIMNIKIYKNLRNNVNRIINCETSNINKTITTASKQIQAINYIISQKGIDYLDDDLKEIATKRLGNPEMSLSEFLKILSFKISKSGLNHRLKKIEKISDNLKK